MVKHVVTQVKYVGHYFTLSDNSSCKYHSNCQSPFDDHGYIIIDLCMFYNGCNVASFYGWKRQTLVIWQKIMDLLLPTKYFEIYRELVQIKQSLYYQELSWCTDYIFWQTLFSTFLTSLILRDLRFNEM